MEEMDENNYGESFTLMIASGKYKTQITKKFQNRKVWVVPNPNLISAVIPGTIIDVYVKPGQSVKKGEVLLILEAMKMQNQILMPFDGKIKTINVKPDERIPKKFVMIELA
jgi:biotin carboxyl carrier protein